MSVHGGMVKALHVHVRYVERNSIVNIYGANGSMIAIYNHKADTTAYYNEENDTGTWAPTEIYYIESSHACSSVDIEIAIIERVAFEIIWDIIEFYIVLKMLTEARSRSPPYM